MKGIEAQPILGRKKLNIESILNKYGKMTITRMSKTTRTWRNTDPNFIALLEGTTVSIAPEDNKDGKIWGYLNNGTPVRRAVMTPGFSPKTRPGFLGSGQGQGGVAFISKDLTLPGIEARGWTQLIVDELGPKFVVDVNKMLSKSIL